MPKGTCWAKTTSNSEKIKPVTLAVVKLHLSKGISQSVTQSVKNWLNKHYFKFHSNLLKVFRVDLKACLGLVLPNQYCLIIGRKIEAGFLDNDILWATPTPLWSLLYSTIVLYDMYVILLSR